MKKLDNFSNCLAVLKSADFNFADNNEIYRTGIIGQFNLTFELAWKALQEILKMHSVKGTATSSHNEDEIDEMLLLIRNSFIPAFTLLEETLRKKLEEAENDWNEV